MISIISIMYICLSLSIIFFLVFCKEAYALRLTEEHTSTRSHTHSRWILVSRNELMIQAGHIGRQK